MGIKQQGIKVKMKLKGKIIYPGKCRGKVLFLHAPLSFYGGVDPDTGKIIQDNHPQKGKSLQNKIVVLSNSTGSTVGSWTILRLAENKKAPLAFITENCDSVLATGSILAEIPHLDNIPIKLLAKIDQLALEQQSINFSPVESDYHFQPKTEPGDDFIIKLGGSVITCKDNPQPRVNSQAITNLAKKLRETKRKFILVHGAGSYGHQPVSRHNLLKRELTLETRVLWSKVQTFQYQLNSQLCNIFQENKLPAYPVQPSAIFRKSGQNLILNPAPVEFLFNNNFIPVLYGTPFFNFAGKIEILSGDTICLMLAKELGFPQIIHLTDAPGFYLKQKQQKKIIKEIKTFQWPGLRQPAIEQLKTGNDTLPDVTGGMIGKMDSLIQAAAAGIESYIIDGNNPSSLEELLQGINSGTRIIPD
jgi:isopentenyl phosphate kinase/predicted aconitase with swiveling domain